MINLYIDQIFLALSVLSLVVWTVAAWRWLRNAHSIALGKFHRILLWSVIISGILGQIARSLDDTISPQAIQVAIGMVRGWYLIAGVALALTVPPKLNKPKEEK